MTLQDLIDDAKEYKVEPKRILICDGTVLRQMVQYQLITAKIKDESVHLMFLDTHEMDLNEMQVMYTIRNIAEDGDASTVPNAT